MRFELIPNKKDSKILVLNKEGFLFSFTSREEVAEFVVALNVMANEVFGPQIDYQNKREIF